ncbi:MAG: DUF362 domain-containing protein [Thermodesulfobacteriota bacterium]
MSRVWVRNASYEESRLTGLIPELIDSVHPGLVRPGDRVLIKPNFLVPAKPEQAVLTHPLLVRTAAAYVRDHGGVPFISDSSAFGSFHRLMKQGGYEAALADLDVAVEPFETSTEVDIGEPFGKIELAKAAMEADKVINLPKLKTHSQMLLTLAVKNLFGTVVGWRKAEWHLKAGISRQTFAQLLVGIYRAVSPAITIMDGIDALEGNGPGKRGKPRHLGIIMAGTDAFAMDSAVCAMLGMAPERLPTNAEAVKSGASDLAYTIDGNLPAVRDFHLPKPGRLTVGPAFMQGFIRKHLVQRPVADENLCRLCGHCAQYCPASAIVCGKDGMHFDYDRCIRCFCCIEICPDGAMTTADTWVGRIVGRMLDLHA